MNCPLCGEVCRCHSEPPPPAFPRWRADAGNASAPAAPLVSPPAATVEAQFIDPEVPDLSEERFAASLEADMPAVSLQPSRDGLQPSATITESPVANNAADHVSNYDANHVSETVAQANSPAEADPASGQPDASAWRDELSARLNRFRARRKIRPPRYPSLRLPFDSVEPSGNAHSGGGASSSPVFELLSNHALALDGMRQAPPSAANPDVESRQTAGAPWVKETSVEQAWSEPARIGEARADAVSVDAAPPAASEPSRLAGAKIIEFPRSAWGPPPPPPDQLAEPVVDRPRILEVPEMAPPPPALGGITIEAAASPEPEKQPGVDIPLQNASLPRRVLASGIDGMIIAVASALFGFIFWGVAAVRPPLAQVVGLAAGIPCLFWAVYQYLLIVYAASTPGLRVAGLELARFDGTATTRSLRRWRVLASFLSAGSLGMGYAWVFLDEDALCWHDRITHTYLAPNRQVAQGVDSAT